MVLFSGYKVKFEQSVFRYANTNKLDFDVNVIMVNMTFPPFVFDNFHQTLFFVEKICLQTVEVYINHNLS